MGSYNLGTSWMDRLKGGLVLRGSLKVHVFVQWLFLVPLKGGSSILPSRGLYNPYHPLQEPEKSTDLLNQ